MKMKAVGKQPSFFCFLRKQKKIDKFFLQSSIFLLLLHNNLVRIEHYRHQHSYSNEKSNPILPAPLLYDSDTGSQLQIPCCREDRRDAALYGSQRSDPYVQ